MIIILICHRPLLFVLTISAAVRALAIEAISIASIDLVAGKSGVIAEIFSAGLTVRATPTGTSQPGNTDSLTQLEVIDIHAERIGIPMPGKQLQSTPIPR